MICVYASIMTGLFLFSFTAIMCVLFSDMEIIRIGFLSICMFCLGSSFVMAITEPEEKVKIVPVRKFQIFNLKEPEYIEIPLPSAKANKGA